MIAPDFWGKGVLCANRLSSFTITFQVVETVKKKGELRLNF